MSVVLQNNILPLIESQQLYCPENPKKKPALYSLSEEFDLSNQYTRPGSSRKKKKPMSLSEYWALASDLWDLDKPDIIAALERRGEYDYAHRIAYCKKRVFRMKCKHWFETGKPSHDTELRLPFTCHTPCCPDCSQVYSEQKAKELMLQLSSFELPKGYFYQFGTLTKKVRIASDGQREMPDKEDLRELFKKARVFINEFFPRRELVTRKCGKRCRKDHLHLSRDVYRSTYCGAVGVLEIGKGGNAHIHFLAVGPLYSRSKMSQRWLELTRDSYIVEFKPIRRLLYPQGKKNNLEAAIFEVLKYIRKPVMYDSYEMTADMLLLYVGRTEVDADGLRHHKVGVFRRIHTFGVFYNPRTAGGALEGFPKTEHVNLTCGECGQKFAFYRFDDENLWWDEKTFRAYYALDG